MNIHRYCGSEESAYCRNTQISKQYYLGPKLNGFQRMVIVQAASNNCPAASDECHLVIGIHL